MLLYLGMVLNQRRPQSSIQDTLPEKPFQSVSSVSTGEPLQHRRTVPERLEILDYVIKPFFVIAIMVNLVIIFFRQLTNGYESTTGINFNNTLIVSFLVLSLLGGLFSHTRYNMRRYYMLPKESLFEKTLFILGNIFFGMGVLAVVGYPILQAFALYQWGK